MGWQYQWLQITKMYPCRKIRKQRHTGVVKLMYIHFLQRYIKTCKHMSVFVSTGLVSLLVEWRGRLGLICHIVREWKENEWLFYSTEGRSSWHVRLDQDQVWPSKCPPPPPLPSWTLPACCVFTLSFSSPHKLPSKQPLDRNITSQMMGQMIKAKPMLGPRKSDCFQWYSR